MGPAEKHAVLPPSLAPRGLSRVQAAVYIGVGATKFDEMVADGRMPKPFTANGFGNWFRRRCDEAGLPHCSAHGLRKAGATIAAENGATEHQLMAMYGWESPKQAALYTRTADRKRLIGGAMHLLVPTESVPPMAGVASSGTNKGKKA